MLEVLQQKDGRYVVRDVGGIALDDVVGVFDSKREAQEWLLDHSLDAEASHSGLDVMKPGDEEGRC